jgi:hypothetical protein
MGTGETSAGRDADSRTGAGRAHRWRRLLEDGTYRSAGEIAESESITRSYIIRLLSLTLLAPDIVEAILDGRPPKVMQFDELTRVMPSGWGEQRRAVAMAGSWSHASLVIAVHQSRTAEYGQHQ